jgi:hypothetical protein
MALTPLQRRILRIIAKNRSPDSHIAGGAPLARISGRVSDDIDVFHDAEEAVLRAVEMDVGDQSEFKLCRQRIARRVCRRRSARHEKNLLAATHQARDLFAILPLDQVGHLYLDRKGRALLPDPRGVAEGRLTLHGAVLRGAWPALGPVPIT